MNRVIALIASAVVFAFLALSFLSHDALAQNTSLVGTWTLLSIDNVAADGSRTPGYGANPAGIATFDAAGRYTIQVQSTGRPKFASNNRLKGTPEENQAFVQGSNPHWGRYSVNDTDHTITFQIEHAAYPNWDGIQQIRPFTLVGDVLKYFAASSGSGTVEVVWQRAKLAMAADSGLITKPSSYSVTETAERFENAVKAKGQRVFGRVDHAEAAAKVGIEFKPHITVLFGRPEAGTPLLKQAGTYTIDAPQKVAIWQDEQGKVWLTYNSAEYFASHLLPRHGLQFNPDQVKNLQQFLDQVTDQATK